MRGGPISGQGAPNWWIARTVRATIGRVILALYRVKFTGAENLPEGGAVLAANHVSYLDPVIVWCGTPHPAHFMAKTELWDHGFLGWVIDRLWVFSVDREAMDREALATADSLLKRGEWIGIFPEGTRNRTNPDELGEASGGTAFIAQRAGVPVVPIGISGTDKAWPPGKKLPKLVRVTVRYGEPIYPGDFEGSRKQVVDAMTAEIMKRIADLREKGRAE